MNSGELLLASSSALRALDRGGGGGKEPFVSAALTGLSRNSTTSKATQLLLRNPFSSAVS